MLVCRYFRHVIFWLHMQDNMINIPLIVQDCRSTEMTCRVLRSGLAGRQDGFIRMMCILLKPHEVEARVLVAHPSIPSYSIAVQDVLHNRFTAKQRRLRSNAVKPTDTVCWPATRCAQSLPRSCSQHRACATRDTLLLRHPGVVADQMASS